MPEITGLKPFSPNALEVSAGMQVPNGGLCASGLDLANLAGGKNGSVGRDHGEILI